MLIKFTVGNFKVFKEKATLDMRASSISDHVLTHIHTVEENKLLKSAAIYGKNAAGKSKLIHALEFMQTFVIESSKDRQSNDAIEIDPFRLHTETRNAPSFFEIQFLLKGIQYRYGFEVTTQKIEKEWLLERKIKKEYPLFLRIQDEFEIDLKRFPEGKEKENWTRKNALFLSLVAQLNGSLSQQIIDWFAKINFVHHVCECDVSNYNTEELLVTNQVKKATIINLMKWADLDIKDLEVLEVKDTMSPKTGKKVDLPYSDSFVVTYHDVFDDKNNIVDLENFNLNEDESDGTIRFFNLIGFIIEAIEKGEIIVLDEIDARLHTLLIQALVLQFNSPQNQNAQFIFTTHDTNLLSNEIMRRDQFYFVEKNRFGASSLYSLANFRIEDRKVRKDVNYEMNYLKGRFGAIAHINGTDNPF